MTIAEQALDDDRCADAHCPARASCRRFVASPLLGVWVNVGFQIRRGNAARCDAHVPSAQPDAVRAC